MSEEPPRIVATAGFSTCDLCDLHGAALGATLHVLPPVFRDLGGVPAFSGSVVTVKCFEDNMVVRAALEQAGQGRVLVVDGGGSLRRALVGGNIGAMAAGNGWAGIVVNGAVRDAAELAACALGIRALALMPMPPEKRLPGERDIAVHVQGVWIRPGDRLYADADGIVVIAAAA